MHSAKSLNPTQNDVGVFRSASTIGELTTPLFFTTSLLGDVTDAGVTHSGVTGEQDCVRCAVSSVLSSGSSLVGEVMGEATTDVTTGEVSTDEVMGDDLGEVTGEVMGEVMGAILGNCSLSDRLSTY